MKILMLKTAYGMDNKYGLMKFEGGKEYVVSDMTCSLLVNNGSAKYLGRA